MRIISGTHKGKRLTAPKNLPVRPTTDMAKEALFNILNNRYYFDDISVLDLFSGTGNIAFEFASRGCQNLTAVDQNSNCINYIERTSKELNFPIFSIKGEVFSFLEKNQNSYDIVFADPPYDLPIEEFEKLVKIILQKNMLSATGCLIMEHGSRMDLSHIELFSEKRKYGGSTFSFFEPGQKVNQKYN